MDIIISDASAVLRNLTWPGTGRLVSEFINTVRQHAQHMEKLLIDYDQVFFIFDRYNSDSIKGEERLVRSKGVTRTYVLSPGVEMPAQKIVTSVTRNKVQLIDLIVASLTDDPILSKSCLILTGSQETPYKIQDGKVELCHELRTLHEESDVVIINQLIWAVRDENPATNVLVKCDDTDVFVLLVHYYSKLNLPNLTCCLMMQGPVKGRKLIDIGLTVVQIREKLKINPENLLALHALSGNDTVAACHGIGKGKALKVLREHGSLSFNLLGDLSCDFDALYFSTQWQDNSYPSAMESNLRINRALSFQQESRYRGMVQEGLYKHPIQSLAKANTPIYLPSSNMEIV